VPIDLLIEWDDHTLAESAGFSGLSGLRGATAHKKPEHGWQTL
jgi:hypothetical protein